MFSCEHIEYLLIAVQLVGPTYIRVCLSVYGQMINVNKVSLVTREIQNNQPHQIIATLDLTAF